MEKTVTIMGVTALAAWVFDFLGWRGRGRQGDFPEALRFMSWPGW